jgi:hypothetical protein
MSDKNVPAVPDSQVMARFGTDDKALVAVLALNPYELAAGGVALTPQSLGVIEKLDTRRLVRWWSQCKTPRRFVKRRKGKAGLELDYVDAGFVEQILTFYFPGRWGTRDVKLFHEGGQWHAEGVFWVIHSDSHEQSMFVTGQCDVKTYGKDHPMKGQPMSVGFDRKGAVSDMIKKGAAMMLGIAFDIYNRRDPSIPQASASEANGESSEKAGTALRSVFLEVDGVMAMAADAIDGHPSTYTPAAIWADALALAPRIKTADGKVPVFADREAVVTELLRVLGRDELLSVYSKAKSKYLNPSSQWRKELKAKLDALGPIELGIRQGNPEYRTVRKVFADAVRKLYPGKTDETVGAVIEATVRALFPDRKWWQLSGPEYSSLLESIKSARTRTGRSEE